MVKSGLSVEGFEQKLRSALPRWTHAFAWDITSPFKKLSEQMIPADWIVLAQSVHKAFCDEARGVVVVHGTDTLAYSAAALSMMLQNPPGPVVFTGANNPIDRPDTDAFQNMSHALLFASRPYFSGVSVVFAGSPESRSVILQGTRIRKHASRLDCFQPAFGDPLGHIGGYLPWHRSRVFMNPRVTPAPFGSSDAQYRTAIGVNPAVAYLDFHPGFLAELVLRTVESGVRVIILGAYGSGTVCTEEECGLTKALRTAIESGCLVFIVSKNSGNVALAEYGSSRTLSQIGCVGLGRMTPEVAVVKAMWALSQASDREGVSQYMLNSFTGEI